MSVEASVRRIVALNREVGVELDDSLAPSSSAEIAEMLERHDGRVHGELVEFYRCWPFPVDRFGCGPQLREGLVPLFPSWTDPHVSRDVMFLPPIVTELGLVPMDEYWVTWLTEDDQQVFVSERGPVWWWNIREDRAYCPVRIATSVSEFLAREVAFFERPDVQWLHSAVSGPAPQFEGFEPSPPTSDDEAVALSERLRGGADPGT